MCTVKSDGSVDTGNDVTGPGQTWDPIGDVANAAGVFGEPIRAVGNAVGAAGNIAGQITNPISSAFGQATRGLTSEDLINAFVNVFTGGAIGIKNGQIGAGALARGLDETVGEVTGRNVARKAAMTTQDQIRAAKEAAARDRAFGLQQQEAAERQLSNKARGSSARANSASGDTGGSGVEQQMAVDFLGL